MTIQVTQANFNDEIVNSDKPVLVDFWAGWCGPCKMLGPVVEELSNEHPEYKVCKIDVDAEQALAAQFGVQSIPTVVAFKGGKEVARSVGFVPKEKLLALLQ